MEPMRFREADCPEYPERICIITVSGKEDEKSGQN